MDAAALAALVAQYGLAAVFVGCLLEGETVLMVAAAAAHLGYLALPEVIGVAAVAGFLGDQIAFAVGRGAGPRLAARWPALARRVERARTRLGGADTWVVILMRFAVGMRIALAIAIGASGMSRARFALLNAIGAAAWALAFGTLGYAFGAALAEALKRFGHDLWITLVLVACVAVGYVGVRALRARRRRTASPGD